MNSRLVPLIAQRFLASQASGGFLSFISLVSVMGVALGVLALVSVTSVLNGFQGELVRTVTGLNGEVILYTREVPVQDPELQVARIFKVAPQVTHVTPSFMAELMVAGPHGVGGALLEGVDPGTVQQVTDIGRRLVAGRLPVEPDEVAVAQILAERIGATVGEEVRLVAPFAAEGEPAAAVRKVTGILNLGFYQYDSKYMFGTLEGTQAFLGQPGRVTSFKLKLKPGADAPATAERLSDQFGYPFRARDWARLNRNLLYATKVEKFVISIILTIIVVVAAFNVVSTLLMMIHDKVRDIAILKAMGFNSQQTFRLFCMIGTGIGLAGTVAGVVLGVGVNRALERSGLLNLPPDVYHLASFPIRENWIEIALIAGTALLITFFASLYPAIAVARRSPLEGIRYE